ncbi:MAG: hypothetical protein ABR974_07165 [Bacteroidales bacterium]|jgi:hypothetical protein
MRTKIIPIISVFIFAVLILSSCEDSTYKEYTGNLPVYMTYDQLRSSVTNGNTADLKDPGKIYFKDNYIFIVEELKGIHIYDNSDPSAPVRKDFITIPGVIDISISGSALYADSYVDIVVLDVQDITNVHEIGRVKDILPYTLPPTGNTYPDAIIDETKGVVSGWNVGTIREKVNNQNPYPYPIYFDNAIAYLDKVNSSGASTGVSGSGVGLGGSMARFGIKGNVLYAVDQNILKIFDISDKVHPASVTSFYPGWEIETMFLTDKNMFLGASTGMAIYDISVPSVPVYLSYYSHIRSCDPVIVDDTLAYVTLRSGTTCGSSVNSLDVINVKNLASPSIVMSYPMTSPQGLGKDGNLLFVCDGDAGLKIFDASDPYSISTHLISTYDQINAYDVIPVDGVLAMIGDDGLYQYNYSNPAHITFLSKIGVVK